MNFRQVHLDFHTSECIDGIGERFDKEQFQSALKRGHVNSITVFSKCHHGWAYHPSVANEMHPGLKFDLLAAEIEAAHEIGVKTPVYISAGLDEKYVRKHPDHRVENIRHEFDNFSTPGYHLLCMNTPYLDYLLEQIKEVLLKYDGDGIFLDIVGVRPCCCPSCMKSIMARGKDPNVEANIIEQAEITYKNYYDRVNALVNDIKPGTPVFQNAGHIRHGRRDLAYCNTHLEIESLPTGGWGYDHFPLAAKYSQNLGLEYLGMTGKFHTSWGEFGGYKHPNALRYEVALSAAMGAKCSIGDQLHPSGFMDMTTYGIIGEAYAELEEIEPWCEGTKPVCDVALFTTEAYNNLSVSKTNGISTSNTDAGASRILLEGKYQFSVIDMDCDLSKYKVVILPDAIEYDERLYKKLREYVNGGGKILASGRSAIADGAFEFDLGATYKGKSEFTPAYARLADDENATDYIMDTNHAVVAPTADAQIIAHAVAPYCNRAADHFCSHRHTPSSSVIEGAAATVGKEGAYIAYEIFTDYAPTGELFAKTLVCKTLDALLGEDKLLSTSLGSMGVCTLRERAEGYVCHMLYAVPTKRGKDIEIIEDIYPVHNVTVSLHIPERATRVYLAPEGKDVPFTQENGRVVIEGITIDCARVIAIDVER